MWDDDVSLDRLRKCRRVSVVSGGSVGLRHQPGAAGFSGLSKCGSVWSCPCCAAKIARERASDLEVVLDWAVDQAHTVAMVTFTFKHHDGIRLGKGWDAMQYAWNSVTNHRLYTGESDDEYRKKVEGETDEEWERKHARYRDRLEQWVAGGSKGKRPAEPRRRIGWENHGRLKGKPKPERVIGWRDRWGDLGWARAVEVNGLGANGWHPHLHVVWVFEGQLSEDMVKAACAELFPIWQKALQRQGFDAQEEWVKEDGSIGGAIDVRVSSEQTAAGLAKYFTKFVALEVTGAVNKKGRGKGLAPFQIATAAFIDGDADAYDAWAEWTNVSKGRQQLTWGGRLRQLAGLAREQRSDDDIAKDNLGDADELILPVETWAVVRWEQAQLLNATEKGGIPAAIKWLEARDLDWIRPAQRPTDSAGVTDGRAPSVPPAKPPPVV